MPTSYEVDTFLGEVDTFFQKKTLYLPTKELLGNIPKNRIGKRQYIFTYYKNRLIGIMLHIFRIGQTYLDIVPIGQRPGLFADKERFC